MFSTSKVTPLNKITFLCIHITQTTLKPTCFPRQSSGADDVDSEKGVEAEVNGGGVK